MLVSHEVPLCLLQQSRSFNDYEYCLVHLLDQEPIYKAFYQESVRMGRRVLLDNSIFELGTAFEADKFAEKIVELRPFEYIVPDSLENKDQTIQNFDSWLTTYGDLPGKKIGVIQGKTKEELFDCYKYMREKADKIAISFDYGYYLLTQRGPTKYWKWMLGRQELLQDLMDEGFIASWKPHHLLGCAIPKEFEYYAYHPNSSGISISSLKFIETVDTSSPIVHAIRGVKYPENFTEWKKESIKLVDLLHTPREDISDELLSYNLKKFKQYVGRDE